jgi:hypothetical protein
MDLLGGNGNSSNSLANIAARGRGGGRGGNRGRGNRGRGGNFGGRGRGNYNSGKAKIRCQLCKKEGHSVVDCWHRYEEDFVPREDKSTNAVSNGNYGVDSN